MPRILEVMFSGESERLGHSHGRYKCQKYRDDEWEWRFRPTYIEIVPLKESEFETIMYPYDNIFYMVVMIVD